MCVCGGGSHHVGGCGTVTFCSGLLPCTPAPINERPPRSILRVNTTPHGHDSCSHRACCFPRGVVPQGEHAEPRCLRPRCPTRLRFPGPVGQLRLDLGWELLIGPAIPVPAATGPCARGKWRPTTQRDIPGLAERLPFISALPGRVHLFCWR